MTRNSNSDEFQSTSVRVTPRWPHEQAVNNAPG